MINEFRGSNERAWVKGFVGDFELGFEVRVFDVYRECLSFWVVGTCKGVFVLSMELCRLLVLGRDKEGVVILIEIGKVVIRKLRILDCGYMGCGFCCRNLDREINRIFCLEVSK